jgi:nucleoid-associated protein YgaU
MGPNLGGTTLPKASLSVAEGVASTPFLRFRYNPTEYSVSKSARWSRTAAQGAESAGRAEFTGTDPTTISMEIFFDAFEEPAGDVSGDIRTLLSWTQPTEASRAQRRGRPPLLRFVWGTNPVLQSFMGFLKSVQAKYTMFRVDGTPIRATATITLEEYDSGTPGQNPTSGAREGRRAHVVTEGETLQSVAYEEYGQPALWRGLALFNDIDDPMRVAPGSELLIPTAAEAIRLAGGAR